MAFDRKQALITLRNYLDMETGELREHAFTETWESYREAKKLGGVSPAFCIGGTEKRKQHLQLARKIMRCRKCPGLNIRYVTEAAPGWGSLDARVFFIGQSLHEPGVETGIPFILGSGFLIDAALILNNMKRQDVFWTNAVHCHPLRNRPSTEFEKRSCLPFLWKELKLVNPEFVVAFGNDAAGSLEQILLKGSSLAPHTLKLQHPASVMRSGNPDAKRLWILRLAKALYKYKELKQ